MSDSNISLDEVTGFTVGYNYGKLGGSMLGMTYKKYGYLFIPVAPTLASTKGLEVTKDSAGAFVFTEFYSVRLNRQENSDGDSIYDFYVTGNAINRRGDTIWKADLSGSDDQTPYSVL